MNRLFLLFMVCLFSFNVKSQTAKASLTASGMAIVATDGESAYFTMGGPGVKLARDGWHLGVYMLPSLRYKKDPLIPDVTTVLGTGLVMGRKRIVLSIPFYYLLATKKWEVAAGIGVKLGK
ncbi:MAG: hypothetical protein ACK50E_06005 [Bacteroidota bacterium]